MIEFKDRMYSSLREELELYIRSRKAGSAEAADKASVLCRYIKLQKESDIRLAIRIHRLELIKAAQNIAVCNHRVKLYREDILGFIESNLRSLETSSIKERLLKKLGAPCESSLKEALEQCRQNLCLKGRASIEDTGDLIIEYQESTGRKDPYIQLMAAYFDCRTGQCSKQSVLDTARAVYRANSKDYPISDDIRALLCSSGDAQCNIGAIAAQLQNAILVNLAKDFLYDVGFPLNSRENSEQLTTRAKSAKRKQHPILKLVDMYMAGQNRGMFADNSALAEYLYSEAFAERCIKAYNALSSLSALTADDSSGNAPRLLVPMYIDSMSGAGIYIISKELAEQYTFADCRSKWQGEEDFDMFSHHFAYIYWSAFEHSEEVPLDIRTDMFLCGNNVKAAVDRFFEDSFEYDRFAVFRDFNGELFGNAEGLEQYFEPVISLESHRRNRESDIREQLEMQME